MSGGGCCLAGHHGGRPSIGVCGVCKHHTGQADSTKPRTIGSMLAAIPKFVQATVTADSAMSRKRLEVCSGCEQWTGATCRVCGCFTSLKVRLATEACPMGKWLAEE